MKTAVQWLEEEIGKKNMGTFLEDKIKIAKEMEENQIGSAFLAGGQSAFSFKGNGEFKTIEQYIEETYKKEQP
jgi:hypothetical protein